ncbi:MAG: hypothetical protein PF518_07215 [Spirochaetaceae bacterium]|jgi:putative transposase|nr:hypothetical protein [Spirochaetaceae bacterium]
MPDLYNNKYRIASTRLQKWNYGWNGIYFITICTKNRLHYFGRVRSGKMNLSDIGLLADNLWHENIDHSKNIKLDAFVVMPNHIHGIIIIDKPWDYTNGNIPNRRDKACLVSTFTELSTELSTESPTESIKTIGQKRFQNQGHNTISSIIGSYKSAVSKYAHCLGFEFQWQSRFYDRIIRDKKSYNQIKKYIINNPKNWGHDRFFPGHK